jgi:hypothetical protein
LAQTRRAFGRVSAPPVQVTLLSFDIAGNAASDPVHMALIIVSSALQEPLASSDLTTRSVMPSSPFLRIVPQPKG